MLKIDQKELEKCADYLETHKWGQVQNDSSDKETGFIYYINSYDLLKQLCDLNECDFDYAINRFYNFWCSTACEQMLCELGATKEPNKKDHDKDVFIKGTPFDVKLTLLSSKAPRCDLTSREGKDKLIEWLIQNASQEGRKQNCNRLFIVCVASDYGKMQRLKCNQEKIAKSLLNFMRYYYDKELHKMGDIYADLIIVRE